MIFKAVRFIIYTVSIVFLVVLTVLLLPPIYRRMVTYPALQKEISNFQKLRKEPQGYNGLKIFRGVMHVHSFWSHDSEGTLNDIIPAAKEDNIDFIFLTDHPHGRFDTIPRGYNGYYDGVLVVPGSEQEGFDAWPLDSVIIDWNQDKETIARKIIDRGGLICMAHPEEKRNWGSPWYQGMEIYNFHADTKDEKLVRQVANFIINGRKYPQWSYREMFDEQTAILARWDSLNTRRKIFGFSAVDAHENQNIRARYLPDRRVQWIGPDAHVLDTGRVTFLNRWLFHEPDRSGWIFRFMTDSYTEGFRFITNYVISDAFTVKSLTSHIKQGHLYTAFKSLGDAGGFRFECRDNVDKLTGIMGDSVCTDNVRYLAAVSPLPGQFRLIRNGKLADSSSYNSYMYRWEEPVSEGAYRIEVHIKIRNKDLPWIYSNPVYLYHKRPKAGYNTRTLKK